MKRAAIFTLMSVLGLLTAAQPEGERWWSHVLFLADDALEGRETGSAAHRRAADYVASQFERNGLKVAIGSQYIQPVKLGSRRILEERSSLALVRNGKREALTLGEHAIFGLRTDPPATVSVPMVFVGYGLVVPDRNYNDLAGVDLRGKVAVYLTGSPASMAGPLGSHFQSGSERAKVWQQAGAVATVSITKPRASDTPWTRTSAARLLPAMTLADEAPSSRLSITVNPAHADKFLAGSGHTF